MMRFRNCSNKNSGFTLVELLVVISIVSILASALFMVVNPVRLQRKSKEAVLKANTAKLCTALFSCASIKDTAASCDTFSEMDVPTPTDPVSSVYSASVASSAVTVSGALSTCIYTCSFDFSNGSVTNLPASPPVGCTN